MATAFKNIGQPGTKDLNFYQYNKHQIKGFFLDNQFQYSLQQEQSN